MMQAYSHKTYVTDGRLGACCRAGHLSYDSMFFFVDPDASFELDIELFFSSATNNQDMRARFARYYPQVGD
jgi:hypothetical protein